MPDRPHPSVECPAALPTTDPGSTGPDYSRPELGSSQPAIPGYEVFEELGKGGMGVVYRGRQVAADRVVALKMILGGGALDEHALARFRTEAQAVARLQHPAIVQVFEVGEYRGLPFFSLEFCDEGSLARKLGGTPLPSAEAAALVEALARAVQAAHEKGVVHRDLKPANVLLSSSSGGTTPKIADFGLAKKLDDDTGETVAGAIMGTPSYMAPEQARGEVVGPAADVYALGAILYECLTGRPPFRAATKYDTIQQVIHADPVPPRALQPAVPRDLETVCLKCLNKDLARRYVSASALADDLRRYRAGEPIVARPVSRIERAMKWARRRPTTAALTAALVLGTIGFTYFLNEARVDALGQKEIAEDEREKAKGALRESRIVAANLALERGQTLGDQGDAGAALHWFVRGLEFAPEDERPLRDLLLANLAVWRGQVHSLHERIEHDNSTTVVAVSPDGRLIITVGRGSLRVNCWDVESGRRVGFPIDHPDTVYDVAFSPDGATLLTGCRDGLARLWSLKSRTVVGPPLKHKNSVTAVAFRPDGQAVATVSVDRAVRLWNPVTAQAVGEPMAHGGDVSRIAFRPGGKVLLTAAHDGTIHRWDAATGKAISPPLTHPFPILAAAWLPGGNAALVCDDNLGSFLLDAESWKFIGTKRSHQGRVIDVAVALDGQVAACENENVVLWDVTNHSSDVTTVPHQMQCVGVAFWPGKKRIVVGSNGRPVFLWDLAPGQPVVVQSKPSKGLLGSGFSKVTIRPDGQVVAVGTLRGIVEFFETATGNQLGPSRRAGGPVLSLSYSPDGKKLLVGCMDKVARLYDATTWEPSGPALPHHGMVMSAAFAAEGRMLLTVANTGDPHPRDGGHGGVGDGWVYAWDAATGKPIGPQAKGLGLCLCGVIGSPNGKAALALGHGGAWLLELPSMNLQREFKQQELVLAAAFSPDGRFMASGSSDKTAIVWKLDEGRAVTAQLPHKGPVLNLRFSPDGRFLLTGSQDRAARLWDVATGKRVGPLFQHYNPVQAVAFAPGGQSFIGVTADGTTYTWKMPPRLADEPGRLALWVQVLTARELDKDGGMRFLSDAEWRQRKVQLAALGGSPLP